VSDGDLLWIAGDEQPLLHRLTLQADGSYGAMQTFRLDDLVERLQPGEEVDVEGMDRWDDDLWLVGSHSRTRKEPDPDDDDQDVLRKLAKVQERSNRNVVIRLPLVAEDGAVRPVAADGGQRRAAVLDGDLLAALESDDHLARFLPLPGKDGGLDIEGLVALDDALLLGLRGPVLRGWAVVLELRLRADPDDPGRLRLDGDDDGAGYRSIVLDLNGLGVRDLCRVGDDVLVLAGPTMALDGPFRLFRWSGATAVRRRVVRGADLTRLAELPSGQGADEGLDHPEGLTPLGVEDSDAFLVYDSPAPARVSSSGTVLADVFALPSEAPRGGAERSGRPASRAPAAI
jgi:hypothetical protein